jgi:transposase-like protein
VCRRSLIQIIEARRWRPGVSPDPEAAVDRRPGTELAGHLPPLGTGPTDLFGLVSGGDRCWSLRYTRTMRYAQGGGLTAERRRFREGVRREAGERFARGEKTSVVAKDLRVTERSVERWRRVWRESSVESLVSKGPPRLPKLSAGERTLRRRLSHIQRHPELIDCCLTETGLLFHHPSPTPTDEISDQ